jgi:hypothetical protein
MGSLNRSSDLRRSQLPSTLLEADYNDKLSIVETKDANGNVKAT